MFNVQEREVRIASHILFKIHLYIRLETSCIDWNVQRASGNRDEDSLPESSVGIS